MSTHWWLPHDDWQEQHSHVVKVDAPSAIHSSALVTTLSLHYQCKGMAHRAYVTLYHKAKSSAPTSSTSASGSSTMSFCASWRMSITSFLRESASLSSSACRNECLHTTGPGDATLPMHVLHVDRGGIDARDGGSRGGKVWTAPTCTVQTRRCNMGCSQGRYNIHHWSCF